jgi:hypothetical protein
MADLMTEEKELDRRAMADLMTKEQELDLIDWLKQNTFLYQRRDKKAKEHDPQGIQQIAAWHAKADTMGLEPNLIHRWFRMHKTRYGILVSRERALKERRDNRDQSQPEWDEEASQQGEDTQVTYCCFY